MRAAVVLALLLGACASAHWANDKGETATPEILAACNQQAWARARYEQPAAVPVQVVQKDRSGRVTTSWDQARFPQADAREQSFFNLCMRERGYDLSPAR
jgi:hypothetical protein